MTVLEAMEYMIESGIATEKEIHLVASINGYSIETMNDIAYVRTGYRTVEDVAELDAEC